MGNAAFFAPEAHTVPCNGVPPVISNLSIRESILGELKYGNTNVRQYGSKSALKYGETKIFDLHPDFCDRDFYDGDFCDG
jgi:hypothetical protein